jgi:DNA-binding MarR family transcriptional regulator
MMDYLYHSGDCTIGALTRAMRRAQSSVSELTDRLADRGLVFRDATTDRRKTLVRLTAEGKNWIRSKEQYQRDALLQLLHALETDSKEALREALLQILSTTDRIARN